MTSDSFIRLCDANWHDLQREYAARGFSGVSHDMNCLKNGQMIRLIDGAEPTVSFLHTPPIHMRYLPYK